MSNQLVYHPRIFRISEETVGEFEKEINCLLLQPDITILTIDMSDVRYITSCGLRILSKTATVLKDRGGHIEVMHMVPLVKDILCETGFDSILAMKNGIIHTGDGS